MVMAMLAVVVGIALVTLLAIAAARTRRTLPAGSRDSGGGDVAWMSSVGSRRLRQRRRWRCGGGGGGATAAAVGVAETEIDRPTAWLCTASDTVSVALAPRESVARTVIVTDVGVEGAVHRRARGGLAAQRAGRRRPGQRHLVAVRIVDLGQAASGECLRAPTPRGPTPPRSSPTEDDCRRRRHGVAGGRSASPTVVRHPVEAEHATSARHMKREYGITRGPDLRCQRIRCCPSLRSGATAPPAGVRDAAAHQRDQLPAVDGLDQMVVEADGLRSLAVLGLPVPRDRHQQRDVGRRAAHARSRPPDSRPRPAAPDRAARCPAAARRPAPAPRRRRAP